MSKKVTKKTPLLAQTAKTKAKPKSKLRLQYEEALKELELLKLKVDNNFIRQVNPRGAQIQHDNYGICVLNALGGGCGAGIISGITNVCFMNREAGGWDLDESKKAFEKVLEKARGSSYSILIARLGDAYYKNYDKKMEELGFERIAKYYNLAHSTMTNPSQILYIYYVNKGSIKTTKQDLSAHKVGEK